MTEEKNINLKKVIILVIVFLIISFLAYTFRHKLVSLLPFTTSKVEEKTSSEETTEEEKSENSLLKDYKSSLIKPTSYDEYQELKYGTLYLTNLTVDDKGYNLGFRYDPKSGYYADNIILKINKTLVDTFDTSATLDIKTNGQSYVLGNMQIKKTELDALGINSFSELKLFITEYSTAKERSEDTIVNWNFYNEINPYNSTKGLIEIANIDDIKISYYKRVEDKDNTYLYFDVKNKNNNIYSTVYIKKLLVNGNIYDTENIEINNYPSSENIFYITIPTKTYKEVEEFTVSFICIIKEKDEIISYNITNEYTKTF